MAKQPSTKTTKKPSTVGYEDFLPEGFVQADSGALNAEVSYWIDTGSLALNLLISGSIYGGAPGNRNLQLAGDPGTGKTFFMLEMVRDFLEKHPGSPVFYFDTEQAIDEGMLNRRGLDTSRIFIDQDTNSVEEFAKKSIALLNKYNDAETGIPILIICDSMGRLSSEAQVEAYDKGEPKADTGRRAKAWKEASIIVKGKQRLGRVPMHSTNHVYNAIGAYVPTKVAGGGSGPEYMSDVIVMLSKRKINKGDKETNIDPGDGVILTAHTEKQRFAKPYRKVHLLLDFDNGLHRYYGLLDVAVEYGLVKKLPGGYYEFPNGDKDYEKTINAAPTRFFTKEFLDLFEKEVSPYFQYGGKKKEHDEDGVVSDE